MTTETSAWLSSRHDRVHRPPPPRTAQQRKQALIDVENRARGGNFFYLPCWLAVVATSGLFQTEPRTVVTVALFCLLVAIARLGLHRNFTERVERDERSTRIQFLALLLSNGVMLSALGIAANHWPPLMAVRYQIILVGGVSCAAATMTLAMDPVIRVGMPLSTLVPFLISLCCAPSATNLGIGVLILFFLLYLVKSSKYVYDDYWSAVDAHALLEVRALEFERLSITDPLTQVHNRLHFERRLVDEWQHATRRSEPLTLMIVDLDHFKRINDTYGHPVGDACLQQVAAALKASLNRATDVLARFGGEEFVVLLPVTEGAAAAGVAERLRLAVAGLTIAAPGASVHVTCSIGIATVWPSPQGASSAAMSLADAALYQAKEGGRNRVVAAGDDADALARAAPRQSPSGDGRVRRSKPELV